MRVPRRFVGVLGGGHNRLIGQAQRKRIQPADDRQDGACAQPEAFEHLALFHRGEREFLAGTLPFIHAGLQSGEPTLVAVAPRRGHLLADALGPQAEEVTFVDMHELGRNPARIIPAWQRFLDEHGVETGAVRGVGEPVWPGRSDPELQECCVHEQLLNVAFGEGRPWRLLCPYDLDELDERELTAASRSHPLTATDAGSCVNADYRAPSEPFAGELPAPTMPALELRYDARGLAGVRERVHTSACAVQLGEERGSDLVLAVNELAANSVLHGGGRGTLRIWVQDRALVCEVRDTGRISDPLVGRVEPDTDQLGGRGLWMANQICDLVQIRSGELGTAIRVHMHLG